MTTKVTLTTHGWPVRVRMTDDYDRGDGAHVNMQTTTIMPPDTTQDFHLTDTRTFGFEEMPKPRAEDT